jgi:hypothetical protein
MAYTIVLPEAGFQPIADIETTAWHPLGTRVRAKDPTYGEGEFVYAACAASTAISQYLMVYFLPTSVAVQYVWQPSGTTTTVANAPVATVLPAGGTSTKTGYTVGVAVNAIASNASVQYAWFQVRGEVPILKTAVQVTPNTALYVSGTAGRFYVTASTGKQVLGARSGPVTVTATTSSVVCIISNPVMEGF